ncbi:DUF1499 domain-containing protein [Rhodovulum sp. BSW8]|uniref:DUF1499 domain-containing protein n=1 Tax=Rhodovulum visakhapatnamense TaxID=364297 RepID=A0A4R8FW10_9RHOB|nr:MULTISPECIES: DUF1499 domain-containing protein [Rhodovulum]OLS44445.1 hypothetical protein BV509_08890 [Rhodovulum sulfidophilum]MBL3568825.1 DUF1499 domain-containing protein [Rhodovulum visakhapatnamense]MBL3578152.1 DUF1499 domain-containing protein [Rhodovulum visakhapatnamense]RBO53542.1 DUF1499 domain-containing protein [Rhodovulum sp. BSW8]TDX27717.1 uncharacterized protein (DUF1499 family) [Rhodovulum visakhapatnamense]
MKILPLVLLVLGLAAAGGAVWFRTVPDDPETWHVDPLTAAKPATPNAALVRPEGGDRAAPVYPVTPEALAEAFDAVALAQPRTSRLAGAPGAFFMTYVQRSALWGFPDYISVRILPVEGGATWAAFSRSRYGHSDLGVNAKRLADWQAALEARLAPPAS